MNMCPSCKKNCGEGLWEHYRKVPLSQPALKEKEENLKKDLHVIWYFVQEMAMTLLKQFVNVIMKYMKHSNQLGPRKIQFALASLPQIHVDH